MKRWIPVLFILFLAAAVLPAQVDLGAVGTGTGRTWGGRSPPSRQFVVRLLRTGSYTAAPGRPASRARRFASPLTLYRIRRRSR